VGTEIYWIEKFGRGRLGTMARPLGGSLLEGQISSWKQANVSIVVSALTDHEMTELELLREPELCLSYGIEFVRFPIADRGLPHSIAEWTHFIENLSDQIRDQKAVVIHCRMGIGRSSMIALSVMIALGMGLNDALEAMIFAQRRPIPDTAEQLEWVANFARLRGEVI